MGLRAGDLRGTVYEIFEIDSFASKMGDDSNIVTLSFSVQTKEAADDLVSFFEKGYDFILDADVTAGEQSDGTYKVFVELERKRDVHDHIIEIVDGLKKLAERDQFKFRYYKEFRSHEATLENIQQFVPNDPDNYGITTNESNMNNFKNFFSKSYVESIDMLDDILTIKKMYADPIRFKFVDFGDRENILNNLTESLNFNDFSEVIYLSKYMGDYNITKFGNKLTFENNGKALVLQRL
jgi:RNAse (barnase) inhibitor barstar